MFGVLNLPVVQTRLAKQFATSVNENFQTDIRLERLALGLTGRISLKGVYIGDHHGDTLLYAERLATSAKSIQQLTGGALDFDLLSVSDMSFKVIQYEGESQDAVSLFIKNLKGEAERKQKPLAASVKNIELQNSRFSIYNENKPEVAPLVFDALNLQGQNLQIEGQRTEIEISELHFNDTALGFSVDTLQTHAIITPDTLQFNNSVIQSGDNKVQGDIVFSNSNQSFRNFKSTVSVDMTLKESRIYSNLWSGFTKVFPKKTLFDFRFQAHGTLSELKFDSLQLKTPFLYLDGTLQTNYLFEKTAATTLYLKADTLVLDANRYALENPKPKWIKYLASFDTLKTKGEFGLDRKKLHLAIDAESTAGDLRLDGDFGLGLFSKGKMNTEFEAALNLDKIQPSRFADLKNNKALISGILVLKGDLKAQDQWQLGWQGEQFNYVEGDTKMDGISFEGLWDNGILKNAFNSSAELLQLKSDLRFDFSKPNGKHSLAINIIQADLARLGLPLGNGRGVVKGVVLASLEGAGWDTMQGSIRLSSLAFENIKDTITFNPVAISYVQNEKTAELKIQNTDFIDARFAGAYSLNQIKPLFQNALREVYQFIPEAKTAPNQFINFDLRLTDKILNALYPQYQADKAITFSGTIDSNSNKSRLNLDAPLFRVGDYAFENLHYELNTNNPLYNTYLKFERLKHPRFPVEEMYLISTAIKDTLFFRSEFRGGTLDNDRFALNFYHVMAEPEISHFGIKPSSIQYRNVPWAINPENKSNQQIRVHRSKGAVTIPDIYATSDNQAVRLSGTYANANQMKVALDLRNIVLERFLPFIPNFDLTGVSSMTLDYERSEARNAMQLNGGIDNFSVNGVELGELYISTLGNPLVHSYGVNFEIQKGQSPLLLGQGRVIGNQKPTIDFDLKFNQFPLDFLSPLGKNSIQNIRGAVSGDVNLWGGLRALQHTGQLTLQNGGLRIPYLNVDYAFDDAKIALYNQVFDFGSVAIQDVNEQTKAFMKGKITHTQFKDWGTALQVDTQRLLLLDKFQTPEALFFGKGYLEGGVAMEGPFNALTIAVDGTTAAGTSIKVPWAEDYGLSDNPFIKFVDKSTENRALSTVDLLDSEPITGLELTFDLDVNNEAEIEIVIDPETGSYLDGRGSGNLLMEINTKGKFNMWGDFITFGGIYNFKNLSVIDKKFNVKPGGTIVWEGDPLTAQMNLEAVYEVPGGANPALLLDNPNFNKKIPTEVLIKLQGNLLKPDDPLFEINFPNTNNTVVSEINYRLADPQRSQLQALSLLSQGFFISDVGFSMQGIANNLYQKASDVLSNLLGENSDKLKVGVDFSKGDRLENVALETDDRLGLTLYTEISDRILLNGKIGVPVGGVERTLVVGNVQIDFILNEEGSLTAKVFNRENEFRYLTDELGYTQGVGISYRMDFNTFRELMGKLIRKAKDTASDETRDFPNFSQTGVNFISKN